MLLARTSLGATNASPHDGGVSPPQSATPGILLVVMDVFDAIRSYRPCLSYSTRPVPAGEAHDDPLGRASRPKPAQPTALAVRGGPRRRAQATPRTGFEPGQADRGGARRYRGVRGRGGHSDHDRDLHLGVPLGRRGGGRPSPARGDGRGARHELDHRVQRGEGPLGSPRSRRGPSDRGDPDRLPDRTERLDEGER